MDYFANKLTGSPDAFIEALLKSRPEHTHLEILTDILTQSSGIDERVASFINSAWNWVCYHHLWTTSYESLGDYRKAIGYAETVRPIIQRHKKSELAKLSNCQTILRHWRVPFDQALPSDLRPSMWSKHLLSLIAGLSKRRSHSESIALLRASMTRRPGRGRNKQQLIASDVQRVLDMAVNKRRGSELKKSWVLEKDTDKVIKENPMETPIQPTLEAQPIPPEIRFRQRPAGYLKYPIIAYRLFQGA
jgi:hypothetical protein